MRKSITIILIFCSLMLTAQNQVKNSSFENNLIGYNEFYSWINSNSFAFNYIDSLTTHWNSLYSNSYSFNKNFLERDVFKNILTNNNNSNFFKLCNDKTPVHRSSFALLMPGYRSIDTAKYTPKYWVENTGNPNDSDIYWGYNPVIFSQLYAPLIRDTTYVISYRLLSGKGIGKNKSSYNFINNFGIHFSTNNLGDLSIRPHDRPTFKMNSINLMLQDTVLDTTLNWRYVRREFKADSNYNFIYFGQFLDKRKNKILISKTFFQDYGFYNGGEFTVLFAFFLDHIRLLPKWQYLEVTQDKNACEGDSFSLNVLSGSGPHKWILSSQPSNILSTSSSLKIKADTTSIFQVMSPYDTASIMVYVTKPIYDSISITSCSSYLWRGKLRSATGVYKDTIINTGGCKTYYTLKFKRTINNKVSKLDSTELRADQDSVSYQWYSCNPWTKLDGETKRTIKGSKNNTYAVVLNNGKGCIDTSECISISGSNIVSEEKLDWRVFPNPFQETFNIDLDKSYKEVEIKLYNIYGKLIIHETVKNTRDYYIQNSNLPVGFYYLQVKTENTTKFFNLKKD